MHHTLLQGLYSVRSVFLNQSWKEHHFKFPEDFQSNGFHSGQRITIRVSANAIRHKTFYSQSAFLTLLIGILSHDKSTEIDFKEFLFKKQIRKILKLKCRESASQDPILLAAQFNNIHFILEIFSFQTKSNLSGNFVLCGFVLLVLFSIMLYVAFQCFLITFVLYFHFCSIIVATSYHPLGELIDYIRIIDFFLPLLLLQYIQYL